MRSTNAAALFAWLNRPLLKMGIYEERKALEQSANTLIDRYNEGDKVAKYWFDLINKIIPCDNYTFTERKK